MKIEPISAHEGCTRLWKSEIHFDGIFEGLGLQPQSPANSLHLSLASVWELQIKMQLGKLALYLPLADVLRDQQQQNGLVLEPVTLEDILALSALPTLHRDPFDRLIIAQANRGGFHLATHDPELARYPASVIW